MAQRGKKKAARANGRASTAATIHQLRERIKELEQDLSNHKALLRHYLPVKKFRFTRKELKEMEAYRPTFHEFVAQLKAELKAGA